MIKIMANCIIALVMDKTRLRPQQWWRSVALAFAKEREKKSYPPMRSGNKWKCGSEYESTNHITHNHWEPLGRAGMWWQIRERLRHIKCQILKLLQRRSSVEWKANTTPPPSPTAEFPYIRVHFLFFVSLFLYQLIFKYASVKKREAVKNSRFSSIENVCNIGKTYSRYIRFTFRNIKSQKWFSPQNESQIMSARPD